MELELLDDPGLDRTLRGAHAGPGPSSEEARAAQRVGDEEATARRLAALDEFLAAYESAYGPIGAEEMDAAAQRLRARRPGGG